MSGAGGEPGLDVDEVFSTDLYRGTGQDGLVITNEVDLDGSGGLVWIKRRDAGTENILQDSERGLGTGGTYKQLFTNLTSSENTTTVEGVASFNSNGFTVDNGSDVNKVNNLFASWTFRKAPKFFDVVTYTGTGSAQTISHNLGTTPGFFICKCTSGSSNWKVWHRSLANGASGVMNLNQTGAETSNTTVWNNTLPTDSVFSLGTSTQANENGFEYVAYLFAHNDGDGEFGPDSDQDIIKCGTFEGASATVSLGFEPQWILAKNTDSNSWWMMYDNMRGMPLRGGPAELSPNQNNAETTAPSAESILQTVNVNADGFSVTGGFGSTYIYMAIRRGPLAPPEDATEVFNVTETNSGFTTKITTGFAVDTQLASATSQTSNRWIVDRLRGVRTNLSINTPGLRTNSTDGENLNTGYSLWWDSTGFAIPAEWASINTVFYNWKRAPGFFDVVPYTGDGTAGRTVSHNLGVAPEMIWVKRRSSSALWAVYHKDLGNTKYIQLQSNAAAGTSSVFWNNTSPTSMDFTVGTYTAVNGNADTFIAYLFATLPGISKVGSYTGNGTNQNIDCGFTSGARFILIKPTDAGNSWYVWDSTRGIVAGNDPFLLLDTNDAGITSADYIDPYSGGFNVTGGPGTVNQSGNEHIFYAIA